MGAALGRFSQSFFLIFRRRLTMVVHIFTQSPHPPPHKKATYGPDLNFERKNKLILIF